MQSQWNAFALATQGRWSAMWDRATHVPRRIYGEGIEAPYTVNDANVAAAFARDFLADHLSLLAPGSTIQDFSLVSNQERHGTRVVGFVQSHQGLRVYGGQVSFRFKSDRLVAIGSEALPNIQIDATHARIAVINAPLVATRAISTHAESARATDFGDVIILPLVANHRVLGYRKVVPITVAAERPLGSWQVYVDASSGDLVGTMQTLLFANGNVSYNAPVRRPGAQRIDYPVGLTIVRADGVDVTTTAGGELSWAGNAAASAVTTTTGTFTDVNNVAGDDDTAMFTIAPDGVITWDARADEFIDAQITTYVHAQIVKEFARTLAPELAFLDRVQIANVNIDDTCNAFSDGNTINFFRANAQCANTGRLPDVIYHEFGHSLHANSVIEGVGAFNGAHSEGLSDFLAASITGDPAMGRGFFQSNAPLRHIDPVGMENRWPEDIAGSHHTGLIFAGAMWDLRKMLIQKYGTEEGKALVNRLFYATLERATDIPSTYVEVLVEDDDDGNLANGTPNVCDINAAFGAHGLRNLDIALSPLAAQLPDAGGYPIEVALSGLYPNCPGDQIESVTVGWKLENSEDDLSLIEMTANNNGDGFVGLIPSINDGNIVDYQVQVTLADLTTLKFPNNPADRLYQFYVGETIDLYCTNFDTDPFSEGWAHELVAGDAAGDDWSWGPPMAPAASGDPPAAFLGTNVLGNNLGGEGKNGLYQADTQTFIRSPTIDVMNYSDVHLQYRRWLTVEDGFFDTASILVGNQLAWTNLNSDMGNSSAIHHQDREWRFHDVPISQFARNKKVDLRFQIKSDAGLQMGGWNIDELCVVANVNSICGDGTVSGAEDCDDGAANSDTQANACRSDCRMPICGDGVTDSGEQCDDANTDQLDGCTNDCTLPTDDGGCGCQSGGDGKNGLGLLLFLAAIGLLGRRRRIG